MTPPAPASLRALDLALSVLLVGCAAPEQDPYGQEAGPAWGSEAIINGEIDEDNPAAIAFVSVGPFGASCSGTIIRVVGDQGWALTAAHCADNIVNGMVAVGHLDGPHRELPILEVIANPEYDADFHSYWNDAAVVRFHGADDTLPVVPVATAAEDDLSVGTVVTLAGYGQTETGQGSFQRRSIERPIESLEPDVFFYDQTDGGICFGDSGGPAFADLPAGRRVVGITSVVSGEGCLGFGGSARASDLYESFIEPQLARPSFDSCWHCFGPALQTSSCQALTNACFVQGSACGSYSQCVSGCGADEACRVACGAQYPEGMAQYQEMLECPCSVCGSLCDDELACGGAATGCGFVSNDAPCSTCIDGCCAESRACSNDPGGCATCFPSCEGNAAADALLQCMEASSCVESCGLAPDPIDPVGSGGGSGVGGSGEGGSSGSGGGDGGAGEGAGPSGPSTTSGATTSATNSTGAGPGPGGGASGPSTGSDDDGDDGDGDGGDDAGADPEAGGCSVAASTDRDQVRPFAIALLAAAAAQLVRQRRAPARA